MTHSPALKWSVIALLPLTIGWKAAGKPEDPVDIQQAVVEFLTKQKFEVKLTTDSMEYMHVIEARSDSCHLRVTRVSPLGHQADLVRRTNAERSFYVFRGAAYPEQPVRLTVASYFWFRFLHELGFVLRVPPVLAVSSSCNSEQLPWGTLAAQGPR